MADTQLLFLPVQSKLHPEFKGIYFTYPTKQISSVIGARFVHINQILEQAPDLENYTKSTIFCYYKEAYQLIRAAGFEHACDVTDFQGDTWIVNGIECSMVGTRAYLKGDFQIGERTYDWTLSSILYSSTLGGDLIVPQDLSGSMRYIYNIRPSSNNHNEPRMFLDASRGGLAPQPMVSYYIWNNVLPGEAGSPAISPSTPIIPFEGSIRVYKNIILMNGARIINGEEETTESGIGLDKNIVMMNGAKIFNEDGTQYSI